MPKKSSIRFPQARGKTVKYVEFYSGHEFHYLTIEFSDGKALGIEIRPGVRDS
jgi:hypothetical protein